MEENRAGEIAGLEKRLKAAEESLAKLSAKEKGTGLGLPVCYDIVRAHKGKLQFKSRPGEGTTFSILLPEAGSSANV